MIQERDPMQEFYRRRRDRGEDAKDARRLSDLLRSTSDVVKSEPVAVIAAVSALIAVALIPAWIGTWAAPPTSLSALVFGIVGLWQGLRRRKARWVIWVSAAACVLGIASAAAGIWVASRWLADGTFSL